MRTCPVCGLAARDDASECVQCKHAYGTRSPAAPVAPPQTQPVATPAQSQGQTGTPHGPFSSGPVTIRSAPRPPSIWEVLGNPLARVGYEKEFLKPSDARWRVPDDDRKWFPRFKKTVSVVAWTLWVVVMVQLIVSCIQVYVAGESVTQYMHRDHGRER